MNEADYTHITRDITLAAATTLSGVNPQMVFVYVSGESADSTETSKTMWKRVRGATENALLALPLTTYILRPGFIRPRPGSPSKTWWYKAFYQISVPLYPLLRRVWPSSVTTSENIGRAMITLAADTPDLPAASFAATRSTNSRRPDSLTSKDEAAGDEFQRHGDRAGLRQQQPCQHKNLYGTGLNGRPRREQNADKSSRQCHEADGARLVDSR